MSTLNKRIREIIESKGKISSEMHEKCPEYIDVDYSIEDIVPHYGIDQFA